MCCIREVELYASGVSGAKRKTPAKPTKAPAKPERAPAKPAKSSVKRAPCKEKATEKSNKAGVVGELIGKVEKKLGTGQVKATVGDYIRLVQLHRELEEEDAQDIEVRWIDPEKKEEELDGGT